MHIAAGRDEDFELSSDSDAEQDVGEDGTEAHSSKAEKAHIKLVYTPGAAQSPLWHSQSCLLLQPVIVQNLPALCRDIGLPAC